MTISFFVIHSWDDIKHYGILVKILTNNTFFKIIDYSLHKNDPLFNGWTKPDCEQIKQKIVEQIQKSQIIYITHSPRFDEFGWRMFEIRTANKLHKPIIYLKSHEYIPNNIIPFIDKSLNIYDNAQEIPIITLKMIEGKVINQ